MMLNLVSCTVFAVGGGPCEMMPNLVSHTVLPGQACY